MSTSSGGASASGGGGAGELHVLAVDDSSVGRKLIEKLLTGFPYRGMRPPAPPSLAVISRRRFDGGASVSSHDG